jgi:FimV-like protein
MGKKERGDKIMFIVKRRILHIFFLIPILMLGLFTTSVCYAENPVNEMYGPVSGSDTLGNIVSQNYPDSDLSSKQIMTGILRANPEAFIGGNIHFLLRGATLHLPAEKLISTIKQSDAEKLINNHYQYFRRGKTGSFKIIPLVDNNDNAGDIALEKEVRSILSRSTRSDSESSESETQTSKKPEIDSKKEIKPIVNTAVQTEQAKKSNINNAVKDIELESLRIKVSQLEKILSGRGLSKSTEVNNEISVELKTSLKQQKQKIDALEQERENKNKQLEQLKVKITGLEFSLKEMSLSLVDNRLQATTTDDENSIVSQLKKQNKALKEQLSSLQVELNKKTEEVVTLTAEINTSKQKIDKLEIQLIDSDKENAKLDQQIAAMEAKLAKIRREPVRNIEGVSESTLGFGISPWVWLLPALFLLSILAYLFKRSFSQPKKAIVDDLNSDEKNLQNTETLVVDDNAEMIHQQKTAAVAAAIASAPDIISSANEVESVEASIKLDIGKAYLDMDMSDAAIEILQEAYEEGSEKQCLEAKTLLDKLVQRPL